MSVDFIVRKLKEIEILKNIIIQEKEKEDNNGKINYFEFIKKKQIFNTSYNNIDQIN